MESDVRKRKEKIEKHRAKRVGEKGPGGDNKLKVRKKKRIMREQET